MRLNVQLGEFGETTMVLKHERKTLGHHARPKLSASYYTKDAVILNAVDINCRHLQ